MGTHVFPSEDSKAAIAVNVADGVHPCRHHALLARPVQDVDNLLEKVRLSLDRVKPPRDELIQLGKV